ncbi:unnamed protein product [Sphagnum balticum]
MASKESVSELKLRHLQINKSGGLKSRAADGAGGLGEGEPESTEEEPVTPAGRMFLQPDLCCTILCTMGFQNTINLESFKQAVKNTLVKHKRFTSIVKKNRKGAEIWVKTEVDMDAHVFEPSSISEAEIATPGFVEKYVCDLSIAPPLPTSRPLWECHVLNGTSGNAAAHVILRMHHSLGDGTSLMSLMLACTRQTDNPEKLPSIPVSMGQSSAAAASQSFLQSFWKMLVLLVNSVWGIFYFLATVLWLKDSDTVIKGSAGVERQPKLLVLTELNMEDMKFVKNTVGATINDVLLGMIGASLRRYLQGRYNEASTLPAKHNTSALVNTRASPGLQELEAMMAGGSQVRWGNHMGYLVLPISLKHYSDPLDQVRAAKKVSDSKKASLEGIFTFWSATLLSWLAGPSLTTMLTRRAILQTTLTVSNVPGPIERVMLDNNPIVHIFPVVSGHPQSLCFYLVSYAGKAGLVVMGSKHLIPDPEKLSQYCASTLNEVEDKLLHKTLCGLRTLKF